MPEPRRPRMREVKLAAIFVMHRLRLRFQGLGLRGGNEDVQASFLRWLIPGPTGLNLMSTVLWDLWRRSPSPTTATKGAQKSPLTNYRQTASELRFEPLAMMLSCCLRYFGGRKRGRVVFKIIEVSPDGCPGFGLGKL